MTTVQVAEREIDKTESQEAPEEATPPAAEAASKETNGHPAPTPSPRGPRKASPRAPAPPTKAHAEGDDKVNYVQTLRQRRKDFIREVEEQISAKKAERTSLEKETETKKRALEVDLEMLEEELASMTGGVGAESRAALRPRARPYVRTAKPRPLAKASPKAQPRLKRRSTAEIVDGLAKVVALVSKHKEGLRSEQIREALKFDSREMPMILKTGIDMRKLKAKGEKRSTTYFAKA